MLVRLLTGDPPADFDRCRDALRHRVETEDAVILASNQVIAEAYLVVRHHYGVSPGAARAGLLDLLRSGLVAPRNGPSVLAALEASEPPDLPDRLLVDEYREGGLEVLTADRETASLPGVCLL